MTFAGVAQLRVGDSKVGDSTAQVWGSCEDSLNSPTGYGHHVPFRGLEMQLPLVPGNMYRNICDHNDLFC